MKFEWLVQHFAYHVIKERPVWVPKVIVLVVEEVEVEVALFLEFNGESNTNGKTINFCYKSLSFTWRPKTRTF